MLEKKSFFLILGKIRYKKKLEKFAKSAFTLGKTFSFLLAKI